MDVQKKIISYQESSTVLVRLTCKDGFSVSLLSVGASIRQIGYIDSSGRFKNLALAFFNEGDYFQNPLYAGATLAPAAGRISNGRLPVGSSLYALSRNENGMHSLHGGFHNASFLNWKLLSIEQSTEQVTVVFTCRLSDNLDGFPGNRQFKASYTLTESHQLTVNYEAFSDRDTYFNLSNHSYFNLSGAFSQSAEDHLLRINAGHFICNTPDFIPKYVLPVDDTPFDFRTPCTLRTQYLHYPNDIQLRRNCGYNHGFLLSRGSDTDEPNLLCSLPGQSLSMSVSSDAPCMILYSGGYIEKHRLITGEHSVPSCALAFEFQDYPDAPGNHGFPYHITHAEETWKRWICYRFQVSQI